MTPSPQNPLIQVGEYGRSFVPAWSLVLNRPLTHRLRLTFRLHLACHLDLTYCLHLAKSFLKNMALKPPGLRNWLESWR